jgi:hypothetical protein
MIPSSKEFYRLLSRDSGRFVFQTFADAPDLRSSRQGRANCTRVLAGTGREHYATLKQLSQNGAGVFMAVNEMEEGLNEYGLPKRGVKFIQSVRTYYADIDDLSDPQAKKAALDALLNAELPPSAVVESKNGFHAYWFAIEGEDPEIYGDIEAGIRIFFHGCEGAKDIARVLRAPGFPHLKNPDDPFEVKVIHLQDVRYTAGELAAAYPPPPSEELFRGGIGDIKPPSRVKDHQKVLATIDKAVAIWHTAPWCHDHALGLAARLFWYGLTLDEALSVVSQVVAVTGDDELDDRLAAVRTTYRMGAAGEKISMRAFANPLHSNN